MNSRTNNINNNTVFDTTKQPITCKQTNLISSNAVTPPSPHPYHPLISPAPSINPTPKIASFTPNTIHTHPTRPPSSPNLHFTHSTNHFHSNYHPLSTHQPHPTPTHHNHGNLGFICPFGCPSNVWETVRQCLDLYPLNRPTFDDLVTQFDELIRSQSSQV